MCVFPRRVGVVNSLWLSDVIWRQKSGSALAQLMARCLTASSHHLNHCWLLSVSSSDNYLRAISQMILQLSITIITLKITFLKFHSNLQGANELKMDKDIRTNPLFSLLIVGSYHPSPMSNGDAGLHHKQIECYLAITAESHTVLIRTSLLLTYWHYGNVEAESRLFFEISSAILNEVIQSTKVIWNLWKWENFGRKCFSFFIQHCACWWLNSSPPSAAYMRQWIGAALVQIMACRLFGANPLSKPKLGYCHLDT